MSFQLALDLLRKSNLSQEQADILDTAASAVEVMDVAVDKAIEVRITRHTPIPLLDDLPSYRSLSFGLTFFSIFSILKFCNNSEI